MTAAGAVPDRDPIVARPWRAASPPGRILAIRLQALGDTVLTLPYLRALRQVVPTASLDFLTRAEAADIPRIVLLFDHVFAIRGGRAARWQWLGAAAVLPRLWVRRYDVVIDLQRNRISRAVRRLLRPQAWSEFDRFSPALAGERTRQTIEAIGLGELRVVPDLRLRAPNAGEDLLRAAGWDGTSDLLVLNPAGAFPARHWPVSHYVEFCQVWSQRAASLPQFLLLGDQRMAAAASELRRHLGPRLIDLTGRTTAGEAFAILRRAKLAISEDSGLMHMSWVNGVPTVGLFGASRWVWARPHGNYTALVSTCREPDGVCMDGACRAGAPHCLARQDPGAVAEVALELVARAPGHPKRITPP